MSQFQSVDALELQSVEGGLKPEKVILFGGIMTGGAIFGLAWLYGATAAVVAYS